MKKLNKLAIMLAVASLTGAAFVAPASASDNWNNASGELNWMNGTGELCWRNAYWTPATAAPDCDGALQVAAAPAPEPAPAPAPVAQKVTYAADAFFDFDKSNLKPEGRASLDELVSKIQDINLEVVVAVGHTDSVGTEQYNQGLSERRAESVKQYLVSKGIEASRIYTEGKGELQPIATNQTAAGRAQNRRVEIEVVGTPR
ncbi:MAG: OmpA family protein [Ottowia sp.]|nr:OmpA family protein [Ottowia sp.]